MVALPQLTNLGRRVYVRCDHEVPDFTAEVPKASLVICHGLGEVGVDLNPRTLGPTLELLGSAIFANGHMAVIGWNVKNLYSYVRFHWAAPLGTGCQLVDLAAMEGLLGTRGGRPRDLEEAAARTLRVIRHPNWRRLRGIYDRVHLPLITEVIPELETVGVLDREGRRMLYAHYEVEGQVNGRLRCSKAYKNAYNPHCITPEDKARLLPPGPDDVFLILDFSHLEVSVLQWLSGDDRLGKILSSGEDLYRGIFRSLTGSACDSEKKRSWSKAVFLPVVYGQSAKSLAERLKVSPRTAEMVVGLVYARFPRALGWVRDCQRYAINQCCQDFFGRTRWFDPAESYKVRNFVVQAPAALVCLDKLVKLYRSLPPDARLAAHIHDGYVLYARQSAARATADLAQGVLEADDGLCPGLRLKTSCKIGPSLLEMRGHDEQAEPHKDRSHS
jgi:hypothetical protein